MPVKPRYSAWKAPLWAFFSKAFYADVAYNWTGTGVLYMLVLCSLSWLVAVTLTVALPCVSILCDRGLAEFCQQMPKIKVSSGHLSIDRACPYQVKDDKGETVALFLTNQVVPEKGCPPIVVSSDSLLIAVPGLGAKTWRFDSLALIKTNFNLDVDSSFSTIKKVLPWLPVIYLVVGTPIVFFLHLWQMLLYGFAAMLVARLFKQRIPYKTGLRLAAVAMTPAIVASTLVVVVMALLFPIRLLHLLIVYAPIHSWAVHHPFAVVSVLLALSYLVLAAVSLKEYAQPN